MTRISVRLCASIFAVLATAHVAIAAPAPAPIPAGPSKLPPPAITLADARMIIDGAIAYARAQNAVAAAAVVDAAGNVIAAERMDGVSPNNFTYAEGKAFAAAMQRQTTEDLSRLAKERPDRYFGILGMYPGKMYLVGGGEPIIVNGVLLGAVGVAGLAQFQDEAAGRAGMAAWQRSR